MSNEQVLSIVFGAAIAFYIWYEIIKGAVRAASKDQLAKIEFQNRLLVKMLRQQGVSKEALEGMLNQDSKEFWNSIEV